MTLLSALKPILLFETILILLIVIIILTSLLVKQKNYLRKLRNKFTDIIDPQSSNIKTIVLDAYFKNSIEETLDRYEKLTNSRIIFFDFNRPYSEKAAALRYAYLSIEKEFITSKISNWSLYEKRLEAFLEASDKSNEIENYKNLQEQLKEYKIESQLTIKKLKEIINNLQESVSNSLTPVKEYKDVINSIISDENLSNIRNVFEEMKYFSENMKLHKNNNIAQSINTLEYEFESSDRYITNIKNNSDQGNVNFYEFNKIKESNKIQKNIINDMEQEINSLRESIDASTTQEIKDAKALEINRLERIVQEYEGCVVILEEQIDTLYNQLKEQSQSETQLPSSENNQDLQSLNMELENVSRRMNDIANDYRKAVALNRSIYNFGQCKSAKEVASNIIKLLKEFNIPAGFSINSVIGKIDYFPSLVFNEALKKLVKNSSQKEHMGKINGNNFFVESRIKMLILQSDNEPDSINSTISGLVCVANDSLQLLESIFFQRKNNTHIEDWISLAKSKIANIDIQFSYQAEEQKKIYNQFINDLRKVYPILNLQSENAVLLDKVINEYEARMYLLLSGGDVIDRELSKLISHIGVLKPQN